MINKLHITLVFFVLIQITIHGQTFSKEFGKIGMEEIELRQFDPDKDAEALVLFDIAKSYFIRPDHSFEIVFERSTRIKILSEAGIKWAEIEIPYYQEGGIYEKVYDIEAYAYNYENGRLNKTPLNLSNTYDEKINNYWINKKFAIPNVKEGSIIEYKYKINSQYMFNLRDWEFQWKIPVTYSEYEVRMIPFYEYKWLLQGANKFDSQTSKVDNGFEKDFGPIKYKDMIHKYIMKDLPAFKGEEFITSINDFIIKIDFQLSKIHHPNGSTTQIITTWKDMCTDLLKNGDFGKYVQKSEKLAPKLFNVEHIKLKNEKEKFNIVLDYVKGNYNWNNFYGKYATKSPGKLVEEKHGNGADINLFAIGLLNAMGIDAKPVLISTRGNGKILYNYPYYHFFNYVIILAKIDGENVLTDATDILNLNNRISVKSINDKGLIVQRDKVEWINLESLIPSETKTEILLAIEASKTVHSTITKTATEYDALHYRNNYSGNIETIKKKIETKDYLVNDASIVVQNQLNIEKPYILTYKQSSTPEVVNEKIYVAPFLNEIISDNPLKQKERTYPIDMTYPVKRIFNSTIQIPEGFKVDYLPTEQKINHSLFDLGYTINLTDNQLTVSFDYYFKKSVYAPEDYGLIKYFFNEIINRGNERIVLVKK